MINTSGEENQKVIGTPEILHPISLYQLFYTNTRLDSCALGTRRSFFVAWSTVIAVAVPRAWRSCSTAHCRGRRIVGPTATIPGGGGRGVVRALRRSTGRGRVECSGSWGTVRPGSRCGRRHTRSWGTGVCARGGRRVVPARGRGIVVAGVLAAVTCGGTRGPSWSTAAGRMPCWSSGARRKGVEAAGSCARIVRRSSASVPGWCP